MEPATCPLANLLADETGNELIIAETTSLKGLTGASGVSPFNLY